MEQKICQSCAMPLDDASLQGTNANGTKNDEYCVYCYKDGAFTYDCTMDEMIDHCIEFLDEFNKDLEVPFSKEEAIIQMKEYFPQLKRWRTC